MIIYLAGGEVWWEYFRDLGIRNILLSYFYLRRQKDFSIMARWMEEAKAQGTERGPYRFFLDSGAFTFIEQGKTTEELEEYVDEYAKFLTEDPIAKLFDVVAEVDVYDDDEDNIPRVEGYRERLYEAVGDRLLPTYQTVLGLERWEEICKDSRYKQLGIGGSVSHVDSTAEFVSGYKRVINIAHKHGKTVHGFGVTKLQTDMKYLRNFDSVDSTTWLRADKYGGTFIFQNGHLRILDHTKKYQRSFHKQYFRRIGLDPARILGTRIDHAPHCPGPDSQTKDCPSCKEQLEELRKSSIIAWREISERYERVAPRGFSRVPDSTPKKGVKVLKKPSPTPRDEVVDNELKYAIAAEVVRTDIGQIIPGFTYDPGWRPRLYKSRIGPPEQKPPHHPFGGAKCPHYRLRPASVTDNLQCRNCPYIATCYSTEIYEYVHDRIQDIQENDGPLPLGVSLDAEHGDDGARSAAEQAQGEQGQRRTVHRQVPHDVPTDEAIYDGVEHVVPAEGRSEVRGDLGAQPYRPTTGTSGVDATARGRHLQMGGGERRQTSPDEVREETPTLEQFHAMLGDPALREHERQGVHERAVGLVDVATPLYILEWYQRREEGAREEEPLCPCGKGKLLWLTKQNYLVCISACNRVWRNVKTSPQQPRYMDTTAYSNAVKQGYHDPGLAEQVGREGLAQGGAKSPGRDTLPSLYCPGGGRHAPDRNPDGNHTTAPCPECGKTVRLIAAEGHHIYKYEYHVPGPTTPNAAQKGPSEGPVSTPRHTQGDHPNTTAREGQSPTATPGFTAEATRTSSSSPGFTDTPLQPPMVSPGPQSRELDTQQVRSASAGSHGVAPTSPKPGLERLHQIRSKQRPGVAPAALPLVVEGGLNLGAWRSVIPRVECNVCNLADECPKYQLNSVCYFNQYFDQFDTRNSNHVLAMMQMLVEVEFQRTMQAVLQERITTGGQIDPRITAQINNMVSKLEQLDAMMQERTAPRRDGSFNVSVQLPTAARGEQPSMFMKLFSSPTPALQGSDEGEEKVIPTTGRERTSARHTITGDRMFDPEDDD